MEAHNLKTFKDFLHFYNTMSEMCFSQCVSSFNSRHLEKDEETCVDRCTSKYINCNNRLIKVYADVQEKIVSRRMKELDEEHAKEEAAVAAAATAPESVQLELAEGELMSDGPSTETSIS